VEVEVEVEAMEVTNHLVRQAPVFPPFAGAFGFAH
jgi:hypothetical protein